MIADIAVVARNLLGDALLIATVALTIDGLTIGALVTRDLVAGGVLLMVGTCLVDPALLVLLVALGVLFLARISTVLLSRSLLAGWSSCVAICRTISPRGTVSRRSRGWATATVDRRSAGRSR